MDDETRTFLHGAFSTLEKIYEKHYAAESQGPIGANRRSVSARALSASFAYSLCVKPIPELFMSSVIDFTRLQT